MESNVTRTKEQTPLKVGLRDWRPGSHCTPHPQTLPSRRQPPLWVLVLLGPGLESAWETWREAGNPLQAGR